VGDVKNVYRFLFLVNLKGGTHFETARHSESYHKIGIEEIKYGNVN
jgi:hypothetical protein